MRALVFDGFGLAPRVTELPDPKAPPGGAVVQVVASGLCRSDWHGWQGHDSDIQRFPHVPGHEFAGRIAALGDGVTGWRVGDPVTAPFVQACGSCVVCRAGEGQICPDQKQPGFSDPGSFAEYVVVHAASTNLVRLPDDLPLAHAAALGCRVATAYRALVGRARLKAGEWLTVVGCGGVGLAAVQVGVALGARVVAIDVAREPLDRARQEGAEVTLTFDQIDRAAEATGGGAHVSLDALGSPATAAAAIGSLRRRGRHVQVGLLPGGAHLPMDRVIAWELDLFGSHGMAATDYADLLRWVAQGRLAIERLLAPRAPLGLTEAGEALVAMGAAASPGIVLVDPQLR